jgi:hypothetical protein
MQTQTFDTQLFQKDLETLLSTIRSAGEEDGFYNFKDDLMELAFTEFVASKWFAEASGERRKDLFTQYEMLGWFLNHVGKFVNKYPEAIEITSLTVKEDPPPK